MTLCSRDKDRCEKNFYLESRNEDSRKLSFMLLVDTTGLQVMDQSDIDPSNILIYPNARVLD